MPEIKVTKAQKHIMNAFLALRKTKGLAEVKVVGVCAVADVNHSTFYKYYSDIYDLNRKTGNAAFLRAIKGVKDERSMVRAIDDYVTEEAQYYRWEETPLFIQNLMLFVFDLGGEFLQGHKNAQQLKGILSYMITGAANLILHLKRRKRRELDASDYDILTDRWREGTCALIKYAFPTGIPENKEEFKRFLSALGGKTALKNLR